MDGVLDGFQNLARERGARQMAAYDANWSHGVPGRTPSRRYEWPARGWSAAGAIAATIVALALWLPRHRASSLPPQIAAVQTQAEEDAALLNRVNAELSETIPAPMQPLAKLIDASSGGEQ
jgi:hypothetical protein